MKRVSVRDLNEHLMDVGLSSIGQCSEEDGTCELEESVKREGGAEDATDSRSNVLRRVNAEGDRPRWDYLPSRHSILSLRHGHVSLHSLASLRGRAN